METSLPLKCNKCCIDFSGNFADRNNAFIAYWNKVSYSKQRKINIPLQNSKQFMNSSMEFSINPPLLLLYYIDISFILTESLSQNIIEITNWLTFTGAVRRLGQGQPEYLLSVLVVVQAEEDGVTAGHPGPRVDPAHPGHSHWPLEITGSCSGETFVFILRILLDIFPYYIL